ncbi:MULTISPECIES: hypothetical protein [Kosakonia]|uniref:hypothetical protein n=1 Tax=Kosakonia TaxID=1330547 RepID=UPI0031B6E153
MMPHFVLMIRDAFNESANYLTWSFYSLITAYVSIAMLEKSNFKNKFDNFFSKLLFLISMLIFIPNILFISQVFGDKLGNFAGVASFVICLLMLMLNSVPAITGLVDKKKDL